MLLYGKGKGAELAPLQLPHQLRHILRQRSIEVQPLARHRVFEAQMPGMERLAAEPCQRGAGAIGEFRRAALHPRAIGRVAQ